MKRYIGTLILSLALLFANAQKYDPQKLRNQLKEKNSDSITIEIYRNLHNYYYLSNADSASYFVDKGIAFAESKKYKRGLAVMYTCKSKIAEAHSNLSEAKAFQLKALELFYHFDYYEGILLSYNSLGVIAAKTGDYKQAASYFYRSLHIAEREKNIPGKIQAMVSLGVLNLNIQKFDKAEYYLVSAINLIDDTTNVNFVNVCNNMGTMHAMQADFPNALKWFLRGLNSTGQNSVTPSNISLILNVANVYLNMGELNKAKEYYDKALVFTTKFDMPEERARTLFNISSMYEYSDPKLALNYLYKTLEIAQRINQKHLLAQTYDMIYDMKKALGDYKGACEALEKFSLYKDSVLSADNTSQIELLQSNYDLEKSKLELKDLALQHQKQKNIKTVSFLAILAILIILSVVGFTSYRRRRLNFQLTKSVEVRDKLLSIIAHDLKSPINNVLSLIYELDTDELSIEQKRELLQVLKKQSELSLTTLENILKWGQAQIKGVKTNPENFIANTIINKNIELLDLNAKQKNVKFYLNVDSEIRLYSDANQFDFIIRNLLSNAIKFSNLNSKIEIRILPHNQNFYRISISDNGVGMSIETLNSLFGVNQKVNYGTNNEKGSGLGLMLCKEFVEANEGTIWAESAINEGSTIFFTCKKGK